MATYPRYAPVFRELARYLGVPAHIVSKPSSGDLAAGVPNEDLIGLTMNSWT
jgi:NH3-dependent NAD+ synthetase